MCTAHTTTKNAIFTQKFAMSVTPGDLLHHIEDYVTVVQSVRAKFKNFRKTAQLWKLFCFCFNFLSVL